MVRKPADEIPATRIERVYISLTVHGFIGSGFKGLELESFI